MASNRLQSNRTAVDVSADDFDEPAEQELDFAPLGWEFERDGAIAMLSDEEVDELRERLRVFAEHLEEEARQLRQKFDLLEVVEKPRWYH